MPNESNNNTINVKFHKSANDKTTSNVGKELKKPESLKSPKASKSSKNSKNLVYGSCLLIAIVSIAIIVAVVLLSTKKTVDESYFVSDDTKTVISMTPDSASGGASTNGGHVSTNLVYEYSGEEVSGLKTYFEYTDEESATAAFEILKDQPEFKNGTVEGKYIVVTADESQFKGLKVSDIKQQAEALEQYQKSQATKTEETQIENGESE